MANDFATIHIYVGGAAAQAEVAAAIAAYLSECDYQRIDESALEPYDPRLNLVGQRSRSLYIAAPANGWVSIVDEDIFRLDEPTAEAILLHLSAIGPALLLWSIDQFVWGYTYAADGQVRDRYTEDYLELDAYNPTFLHTPGLSVEQQAPRYMGGTAALADLLQRVEDTGRVQPAHTDEGAGRVPPAPAEGLHTQHSNLKPQTSNLARAGHYINGYRAYYRRTADNELTYMDELIGGGGEIYADAWAKGLAADLGIIQPDATYPALVLAEAQDQLDPHWQAISFRRPPQYQPNYSVALTLYCGQPLPGPTLAAVFRSITDQLPSAGTLGWSEIETGGQYYRDADSVSNLLAGGLNAGEHLAARYYPGCNLIIQRRGDDLPLDLILLEYPSVLDERYTPDVLARAVEAAALREFVLDSRAFPHFAQALFHISGADYGYISVAGGGVGGDGGGRANGPGAMLSDALARPLAQLSSRVAVKEAVSWRSRWRRLERNIRGVYWANLLSPAQLAQVTPLPPSVHVTPLDRGAYLQLACSLTDYAEGKAGAAIELLSSYLLRLLEV